MCSRTLSDPANRLRKTRKKKSSAVLLFEAVTCRQSAPDYPRERGDSQEGGNRRCLPSCAPARRQRTFPRSAERNSPLNPSEKLSARQGRTRLRQFACPGQPVQKRSRPERANPPAAVRVPRSAGAEKSCRPERANRLRGSSAPEGRCRKQKNSTLFRVLLRITHAYAFLINASRRSRPLSISVSEVA